MITPPPLPPLNLSARRRALYDLLSGSEPGDAGQPPAVADEGPPPLSFSQERLWFLDRFQPGVAVYNMPFAVRLRGPVDEAALAASFTEIAFAVQRKT